MASYSLNSRQAFTSFICWLLLAWSTMSTATETQSLDLLHQQVLEHVKQNLDQKLLEPTINVRKLPDSLLLPACQQVLELSQRDTHQLHGRITVSVNCPQPNWRVFISVDIDGKLPAVVSAKGILTQAVINETDVELAHLPINQVRRGAFETLDAVIGKRAKRAIAPNRVITVQMLDIPYWVIERQEVSIVSRIGGIEIKTTGTALENGMQQEQVSVRNNNSNIVVKGIVIAPNTVLVP